MILKLLSQWRAKEWEHHSHEPDALEARLTHRPEQSYVRDFLYGGIDGAVTTFAVVASVEGANLSTRVILILGIASVLADGFSMAASNYSGTKSVADEIVYRRRSEEQQIEHHPDGEIAEVEILLAQKGLSGDALRQAVSEITKDRQKWIDFMLVEEYGLPRFAPSSYGAATATFAAFLLAGVVPLIPYLLGFSSAFIWASVMTAFVFFIIGAWKSQWSTASWWLSGLETLGLGCFAACLAFGAGRLLDFYLL